MIRIANKSDHIEMDAVFRASAEALCVREYDFRRYQLGLEKQGLNGLYAVPMMILTSTLQF